MTVAHPSGDQAHSCLTLAFEGECSCSAPLTSRSVPAQESSSKRFALRPQKLRGCLLGTGTGGGGGRGKGAKGKSEGSTARTDPEDRGGRGPPPEQPEC